MLLNGVHDETDIKDKYGSCHDEPKYGDDCRRVFREIIFDLQNVEACKIVELETVHAYNTKKINISKLARG